MKKTARRTTIAVAMAMVLTGAIWAPTASASLFVADEYPAELSAEQTKMTVWFGGASMHCWPRAFEGELETAGADSVEMYIEGECEMSGKTTTMDTNGCKVILQPGVEDGEGSFKGNADIGGQKCGEIVVDFPNTSCDYNFPPQTLSATFENEGSGSEALVATDLSSTIKYVGTGPNYCFGEMGAGYTQMDHLTPWSITAQDIDGKPIGVYVEKIGVYMSGSEAEPRFDAEAFPVTMSGFQEGPHVIKRSHRTVECDYALYSQVGSLSGPATQLSLEADLFPELYPAIFPCEDPVLGDGATVEMNGCLYLLDVTAGSPYSGEASIQCPEGESIALTIYKPDGNIRCAYSIGSAGRSRCGRLRHGRHR